MPDINQMTSELRGLPDPALQQELQQPTGMVPSYLVLAEVQRRQQMRQAAQKQQSQGQSGSVLDDVVKSMMSGQMPQNGPPAPVGMTPGRQQQPPMPGAAPPSQMQMARGGALRFADGDLVEDDGNDGQGEADRAASQPVNVDDLAEAMIQFEGSRNPSSPGFHANNPGHLKDVGQTGSLGPDASGFARFGNWNIGLQAMKDQIRRNLNRGLTLSEMIGGKKGVYAGWAPAADRNNPGNYINYVAKQTGYDPGLVMQEGGKAAAPGTPIRQPVLAALGATPSFGNVPDTPTKQAAAAPPPSSGQAEVAAEADKATAAEIPPPAPQGEDEDVEDGAEDEAAPAPPASSGPPAKAPAASYVMPSAPQSDLLSTANIARTRQMYDALLGTSPEYRQQLQQERAASIAQLQALRQDAVNRYRNPSPWEFLANIGAGMGASKQLSLPLMFAQGVGAAWQARDEQQDKALTEANALQKQIESIQDVGETERERTGRDMISLIGQQTKTPQGGAKFEDFYKMPNTVYAAMDPTNPQPPRAGMIGVPDPGHPGFGVWIDQNQATQAAKAQQPVGTFERDFLPGWAEQNSTTPDKMTGQQRQQAWTDYRTSLADPTIKAAAQEIAQGIIDGTQPPDMKGLFRYGAQVRAALAAKGYNLTSAMRDWQNVQKFNSTLNGATQTKMRQSTQFVADSIPYTRQLYKDWQATGLPTGYKIFNKAALTAATNLPGDAGEKARLLLSQLSHMTSEVGTMYKGGNNSTDESLRLAGETLQADWNPEQFMGALGQLEKNVQIRRNSWNSISPVGVTPGSPYLAPGQGEGGAAPSGSKPPAGALDNLEPGHTRTFKNGQRWKKNADGSVEQVQ